MMCRKIHTSDGNQQPASEVDVTPSDNIPRRTFSDIDCALLDRDCWLGNIALEPYEDLYWMINCKELDFSTLADYKDD